MITLHHEVVVLNWPDEPALVQQPQRVPAGGSLFFSRQNDRDQSNTYDESTYIELEVDIRSREP